MFHGMVADVGGLGAAIKNRLRKKLHLGEFREFDFSVAAKLATGLSKKVSESAFDDFLNMLVDGGMQCGGRGDASGWEVFVERHGGRGSVTNEIRSAVERWLDQNPLIESYRVGKLVDAWHEE